ncbi:MAG: SPASM domain-containing protein [Clostridia bacterium]|nr:SPASM domain-containing protein [Clostridia bacterium]
MHIFDNYYFDDERMIIIPANSIQYVDLIKKLLKPNVDYEKNLQRIIDSGKLAYTSNQCLPISAGIAMTNNCQLRCRYCINASGEDTSFDNSLLDIYALINFLIRNIKIRKMILKQNEPLTMFFTGAGEPTYNWDLFERTVDYLHDICNKNNIQCITNLTTNGILNDEQIKFVADNISNIMVSFDGLPELQNKNRPFSDRSQSASKTIHSLKSFDRLGVSYSIRSTIWHNDINRLSDMAEFIYSNFCSFTNWSVLPVVSGGRAKKYILKDQDKFKYLFMDSLEQMYNTISQKYNKTNGQIMFLPSSTVDIMCGAMYTSVLWLYPNGDLKVCVDGGEYSPLVGNIKQGKIKLNEKFENVLYTEYSKRFLACRGCLSFRLCAGGCPVKFLRKNNVSSANWECEIIQHYWKFVLDKIMNGENAFGWSGKVKILSRKPYVEILEIKHNDEYVVTYERSKINENYFERL